MRDLVTKSNGNILLQVSISVDRAILPLCDVSRYVLLRKWQTSLYDIHSCRTGKTLMFGQAVQLAW